MQQVEQLFLESLQTTVGKLFLVVLGVGFVLLLITFLPEVIGLLILGIFVFIGFEYLSGKLKP